MDKITKEQLLDYVAPCSLLCYSCPGFTKGIICELSTKLHTYFEGLYDFQVENLPEEQKFRAELFKQFDDTLLRYTQPKCNGCRNKPNPDSSIKGCFIFKCSQEQGVDYCGECDSFPCDKVADLFNTALHARWVKGSRRIREVGIAQFFEEERVKSHYSDFVK